MDDLVKHQQQQIRQDYAHIEGLPEPQGQSSPDLIRGILRRWHIVLITFVLISGGAIPAVWLLVKPKYQATAAIRVAPIIPSILFTDKDSEGVIPMYQNFMNTQADLIVSDQVLQRVADDLADKKLMLFEEKNLFSKQTRNVNPVEALKRAIRDGIITVSPGSKSELIKVSMESLSTREAIQVVDAFIRAYMTIEGSKSAQGGNQKLEVLESEQRAMVEELQRQRETIRQMGEEYGTIALTGRQDMMLARVSDLLQQLTKIETQKLALQSRVQLLEQTNEETIMPEGLIERRHAFINSDPTIQTLTGRVAQLEEKLVMTQQSLAPTNPELQQQTEMLKAFEDRLKHRREELEKTFDEMITRELAESSQGQLAKAKTEFEQTISHEKILKANLEKENTDTIGVGRKQLAIQEQQEQLILNKELYETIRKRIQELEMERKRPARISVAYNASSVLMLNKRIKFTAAILFGSLACGMFLAFLRDKADKSLHTPDDIIRCIGVPVIGTTTRTEQLDKTLLLEHIAYDYQTIRTNLRLLNDGKMPKTLVITSPGMGEGKTTLSINLASSLAQAGNKVLLIDGDLRKPDIAHILNLPKDSLGLPDVLLGLTRFEEAIHTLRLTGLDVLVTNRRNNAAGIEQIARPETANIINEISRNYDNVIIDTSPVLAAPDALLWAKMADAVVLSSLAGRSAGPDLKETLERLAQVNVKILGNVLSNVSAKYSYHRYGYGYYGGNGGDTKGKSSPTSSRPLLLSVQSQSSKTDEAGS